MTVVVKAGWCHEMFQLYRLRIFKCSKSY